jgi:hypothetical protein
MSEEKPTFKITDRRLFNPDGTPRDLAPEETPATPEASQDVEAEASSSPDTASGGGGADSTAASISAAEAASLFSDAGEAAASSSPGAQAAQAVEDFPQDFLMVVEFVASFAADALGMVNHPGAEGREVNLPLAKQCIDMLGTLKKKTRGNLTEEEEQVFDLILSQLRMQYVSLTGGGRVGSPRGGGGGFTGSDITGGR